MDMMRSLADRASHGWVLASTLAVQLVLAAINFPLGELLSDTPLFHIDAAHHWYQIWLAAQLAAQGLLAGYDPWFAAGYLGGISFNTSARLPALLAALFPFWASPAVAFKLVAFACAVASPACIVSAARRLGLGLGECAFAALLAIILWWASPVHWYHTAGVLAWSFAVFAASWFAAWLASYARGQGGWRTALGLMAGGGLLFFSHPLFPMAVVFALLPLLPLVWRELCWRRLPVLLLAVPLACLLLNLPWILEILRHPGMAGGTQPYQQVVDANMIWQDMLGIPGQGRGSKVYLVLVLLALCGVAGGKPSERRLALALSVGALVTVVFADLGSALAKLAVVQPNRFGIQAYVLLLLPAALGGRTVIAAARGDGAMRLAGLVGAAFFALALAYSLNEVRRELTPGPHGHYGMSPPEAGGLGPYSQWALEQLRRETDPGARVLFELSHARVHDGGHMAGFLAVQSGREFIGGAYPFTHFANAWDGWMFGHPLDDIGTDRFREYLGLYNIGWLLLHSDAAKRYVARFPEVGAVSANGPLVLYRVNREHSFFLQGGGEVAGRGVNRLELAKLEGEAVVLKYHWLPGLRTEPPVPLDGVKMLDDPQPFIRIQHPPASLRLFFR